MLLRVVEDCLAVPLADHHMFSESKGAAGRLSRGTRVLSPPDALCRLVCGLAAPRWFLPARAERLGLGGLALKDEGRRSMLGSFKALGAPVALVAEVLRRHPTWDGPSVLAGRYADALEGFYGDQRNRW